MSAQPYPRVRPTASGVGTRLPWWALVLPVAAFLTLLTLMTGSGEAQASLGAHGMAGLLERIQQTLAL
ncbi:MULTISPECIES: hypothetical protein [unclassified Streptomyces]|uniref:hypothetical protein n=1 Tax=unclassified Streptomyces TaxID=2593676 RepID=UPI0016615C11|nr:MULTISPECIES: hypothetical protein [unclassified Streptomyces]MBD0709913.1 hypothetical protein [Streptomyces sp. CBMA291]MBD0716891.1 hypothetical protein [Streptomyces sp. CBMA370]